SPSRPSPRPGAERGRTKMRKLVPLVFLAIALALGIFWLPRASDVASRPETRRLVLIATNDVRARDRRSGCEGSRPPESEPVFVQSCSCKKNAATLTTPALGALLERSAFIASQGGPTQAVVVDAGDLLFAHSNPKESERPDWERRAELMVDAYGFLGVS